MKTPTLLISLIAGGLLQLAAPSKAQDTAQSVLEEMLRRDGSVLAECDFQCKYRNEIWTVHTRTFRTTQVPERPGPGSVEYGQKMEPPDALSFLFPTGTCMAIASRLDPVTLPWGAQQTPMRLLPAASVEGEECKVLVLDGLPRQAHGGGVYADFDIDHAAVTLYVRDGRIKRLTAEVICKSSRGPEPPLTLEAIPRYRSPKPSAERTPSPAPLMELKIDGNPYGIYDFAWSPDGKLLACLTPAIGCTMMSVDSRKELGTIPLSGHVRSVRFTADGKYLLMPDEQGTRLMYLNSQTGKEMKSVPTGAANISVLSQDGSIAFVWDRHISNTHPQLIECQTGRILCELPDVRSSEVQFGSDGKLMAVLDGDHIDIRETSTGRLMHTFASRVAGKVGLGDLRSPVMALSPDSSLLVIADKRLRYAEVQLFGEQGSGSAEAYVYETATGKLVQTLKGMIGSVWTMQFSPDGRILALGDADNQGEIPGQNAAVMLWETKTWKSLGTIAVCPQSAIKQMQFSRDGKSLATLAAGSSSVEIWAVPQP